MPSLTAPLLRLGLLLLAVSATGAALAATTAETPTTTLSARQGVPDVASCLEQSIQRLKIPDDFITSAPLPDGGQRVGLTNPATQQNGLELHVLPTAQGSRIEVYTHGLQYSKAWRKRVEVCSR